MSHNKNYFNPNTEAMFDTYFVVESFGKFKKNDTFTIESWGRTKDKRYYWNVNRNGRKLKVFKDTLKNANINKLIKEL